MPRSRQALAGALTLLATMLAGCGALAVTPPAPTPFDFPGIASELVRRGFGIERIVSGDAGCDDPELARTAIAFDAEGLDQAAPTRIYVYIFRNRDAFDRLRQSVDVCASSYVNDPETFESLETSPFVVAGPGPWAPRFEAALRDVIRTAAGSGG